ncbi:hypothetical protein SLEP1_g58394 [Rubroshorea leprosula]|uniref:Uncharacterized protein n=1 Tax=Rubroshorea leprosula TaxID=152421 RepID=A0AAV5MQ76_9ROSI|nr:hypothetical protein SLEP1_g58394 [Rubroshorea leprosula]
MFACIIHCNALMFLQVAIHRRSILAILILILQVIPESKNCCRGRYYAWVVVY